MESAGVGHSSGIEAMSRQVSGRLVVRLESREGGRLWIRFDDGSALRFELQRGRESVDLVTERPAHECPDAVRPTARQGEYLEFIRRYMTRYGRSPAEADVQRHFLVSAPSVNQMVQMLERKGFIQRERGVPRSIRLVEPRGCRRCNSAHYRRPDEA